MHSRVIRVAAITASITLLACGTVAFLLAGTRSAEKIATHPISEQSPSRAKSRNLSLQPEAFRLSRRLGKRFLPSNLSATTIVGTLTTAGVEKNVTITRQQISTGEDVEIGIAGEAGTLTWNDAEDDKPSGTRTGEAQQILIERVVLDTPDQFILAQLRGANYYTVGHNVRADAGGGDNYNGQLWDVVRIDEPQSARAQRLLSNSRLYYINVQTGLIDKVVSELKGETFQANILEWSDQFGEKFPTHVIWKRGNETVQEFRLTSVSIQTQQ